MASWKGVPSLAVFLTLLLSTRAQDSDTCYTNAYGVVAEQGGWVICPGSANQAGIQTCCASASDCGSDSLCHIAPSENPGANNWYLSGCTDESFQDSSCRTDCGGYQTTWIEYDNDESEWACCGNAPGCNGTVTSTTFTAVAPDQWSRADSSDASSSSSTPSETSTSAPASQGTVASSTISIATSQTVSTPTSTSSSSSSPVEQGNNSSGSNGLSTGAKAGICVACAVAGLALIAAVVALVLRRKSSRRKRSRTASPEMKKEDGRHSAPPPYPPPVEAGGETMKFEMPAQRAPAHELPSNGV